MLTKSLVLAVAIASVIILNSASTGAEPDCSRKRARRQVEAFIDAYNKGDAKTLDRLFAPESRFREYRVGPLERPGPLSEDRSSLLDYFGERHSYRDRFRLLDLRVGDDPNTDGYYTHATLERTSNDPAPWGAGHFEPGKSGVNGRCEITLWRIEWSGP